MKLKYLIITVFISTIMVGCSTINSSTEATKISKNSSTLKDVSSNSKENPIIRAEGISKFGKIIITANGEEQTGQLGADSSFGKSSDYTFNADYNVIFNDLSNNKKIIGTIYHDNIAAIIQPKNVLIKMDKVIINGDELFIFIPQYSGSNDVSMYIFRVDKEGQASQVKFQYDKDSKPGESAPIVTSTSPKFELPSVEENMLVIKSLMAASVGSPDLKFYKLKFKLDNNILILTDKILLN
jgi:hypothetical protein